LKSFLFSTLSKIGLWDNFFVETISRNCRDIKAFETLHVDVDAVVLAAAANRFFSELDPARCGEVCRFSYVESVVKSGVVSFPAFYSFKQKKGGHTRTET
jgi:hypothetical protein